MPAPHITTQCLSDDSSLAGAGGGATRMTSQYRICFEDPQTSILWPRIIRSVSTRHLEGRKGSPVPLDGAQPTDASKSPGSSMPALSIGQRLPNA
eukprot:1415950-Rhodomonas_salina.4